MSAVGVDDEQDVLVYMPDRLNADFTIILPVVDSLQNVVFEDERRVIEAETSDLPVPLVLQLVPIEDHGFS